MSALSDLYDYAKAEGIGIYSYPIGFCAAMSVRQGHRSAIFMDFSQLRTTAEINEAAAHEHGHHAMGAFHKVNSPFELWQRSEYRADRWFYEHYLSPEQFKAAFRAGCSEPWQLAEWFNMPEKRIKKALLYWTECRGIDFAEA